MLFVWDCLYALDVLFVYTDGDDKEVEQDRGGAETIWGIACWDGCSNPSTGCNVSGGLPPVIDLGSTLNVAGGGAFFACFALPMVCGWGMCSSAGGGRFRVEDEWPAPVFGIFFDGGIILLPDQNLWALIVRTKKCFVCLLSVEMQSVPHFTSLFWEQK